MKNETSILEKAGLTDPEKVYDDRGHIKNKILNKFILKQKDVDEVERKEVERHLNWCQRCQERQKQGFLPLE